VVTTTPFIASTFLKPQLLALADHYDVTLALNRGDRYALRLEDERIRVVHLPIRRRISLIWDAIAFIRLAVLFLTRRFSIVHSVAPKAGLLAMGAAWLTRTKPRIHTFQGEVWVTRRGMARLLLRAADKLVARSATHCLVAGRGERDFLVAEGILQAAKGIVLGPGSASGVDTNRFRPDPEARQRGRRLAGLKADDVNILYLGRLNTDKGVLDLARAFARVQTSDARLRLTIVGPDEEELLKPLTLLLAQVAQKVVFLDYSEEPETHLNAADIFVLPSYREGFSTSALEASACGVPIIVSRIYGTRDAVDDGVTGLTFSPGDIEGLAANLITLAADSQLRRQMGEAGRAMVMRNFASDRVLGALLNFYQSIIQPDNLAPAGGRRH
jgi:glycosyltransferase involved in cell wall biosynthesis